MIDTSALVAILLAESDADAFLAEIASAPRACLSAATLLEAHLVIRKIPALVPVLERFLHAAAVEIVPVDEQIARLACLACNRYGKGTRANLNFGDLLSYATAKTLDLPLLFKGEDFVHTDVGKARERKHGPQT